MFKPEVHKAINSLSFSNLIIVNIDANKNPNGGRWSVAKDVKADATAATPKAYVTTVVTATDGNDPDSTDVHYGVGEMYVNSDGEIWIYTGS